MKERKIGLRDGLNTLERLIGRDTPHISGELNNVIVSQALDQVLKTFSGLWIYENCPRGKTKQVVFFRFHTNSVAWKGLIKKQ